MTEQTLMDAKNLLDITKIEFQNILNITAIEGEPCDVVNNPDASKFGLITNATPVPFGLITNTKPVLLQTMVDMDYYPWFSFAGPYIYQLSYGLMQYTMRQQKPDPDVTIRWFEDTICDAIAIHTLKTVINHWSKYDSKFESSEIAIDNMKQFASDGMCTYAHNPLRACKNLDDLKRIEDNCDAEIDRGRDRGHARNYILAVLWLPGMSDSISHIGAYARYINDDNLTIDFERWVSEHPEHTPMIKYLSKIQPDFNGYRQVFVFYPNGDKSRRENHGYSMDID